MELVEKDFELGEMIRQHVTIKQKMCYQNSLSALLALRWLRVLPEHVESARYVEGWMLVFGEIPIEHGWLEIGGKIVDPTLHEEKAEWYFPVHRYSKAEILDFLDERYRLPLFLNDAERNRSMMQFYYDQWAREWHEEIKHEQQAVTHG